MRILVCHPGPAFSVQDVYTGWTEALRDLGLHVVEYNLGDRLTFYDSALFEVGPHLIRKAVSRDQATELAVNGLFASLYKTRPDILFVVSGFFLTPGLLDHVRRCGTRIVMLHTESPYEDERQLALAPHVDLNLVNDPTNISQFRALAPTLYVPHAYRPHIHRPGAPSPDLAADLSFVGTGYASRIWFLEQMDLTGLDVLLGGNWQALDDDSPLHKHLAHDIEECLDNARAADSYRSGRVGLNLYRREAEAEHLAVGWAMGPREVEMAACQMDPRGEGDELFPMLPTFTDPDDATDKLRFWLARDDKRTELAGKAREAVSGRTFHNHAALLMRHVER